MLFPGVFIKIYKVLFLFVFCFMTNHARLLQGFKLKNTDLKMGMIGKPVKLIFFSVLVYVFIGI